MREYARLIRITSFWDFRRLPKISAIDSLFYALQRTRILDNGVSAYIHAMTSIQLYIKASLSFLNSNSLKFLVLEQISRNQLTILSKPPFPRKNSKYRSILAKPVWLSTKLTTIFHSHLIRLVVTLWMKDAWDCCSIRLNRSRGARESQSPEASRAEAWLLAIRWE
jgi:hypothetical protein